MAGKVFEIAFAINGALAQSFKTSMQQARGTLTQYGSQMNELKVQQRALDSALKQGVISMDSYRNATARVGKELEQTAAKDAKLRKAMQNKIAADANARSARSDLGSTMATTAVMAAPLVGMLSKAADFEAVMSKVKAITVSDDKAMQQLTATARELGQNTMFSATQAGEAMTYLGMAGWNSQQIMAGMPGLLNLAAASNTDLARTADIVSDDLTAFGLSAEHAGHMADVFAKTSTSTNTTVEMLGETMKYAAPVAHAFGASLEETAALTGLMANSGIKASAAGTALRSGFLRLAGTSSKSTKAIEEMGLSLSEATAQQEEARAALASLGIAMDDTNGPRKMGAIVRDLADRTKDMSKEQKLATLATIFGTNAASAWVSVIDQGPDKLDQLTKELENSEGAAKEMADEMQNNARGALIKLSSATESVAIAIGSTMLPTLAELGDFLANEAAYVAKVAGQHPELTEGIIKTSVAVAGMVIAYKAARAVYYSVVAAQAAYKLMMESERVATMRNVIASGIHRASMIASSIAMYATAAAQWALNAAMSANPIGLVIIAIVALIAAFVWLGTHFQAVSDFCTSMWESPTAAIIAFMMGPIGWLIYAAMGLIANWDQVKAWFTLLWEDPKAALSQFYDWVMSKLGGLFDWISEKWEWVRSIFSRPIQARVEGSATANGQSIQHNAKGGIYGKGPFLTTFAEESDEAAIPINGTPRAKALWRQTGEMMGLLPGEGNSVISVSAPINITVNGSADASAVQQIKSAVGGAMDDLEARLAEIQNRKGRVSYA
ncbi:phage tail tape measure protein [Veillonella sp.]|uniref:phage tail tape measure protein n=1 Tax=Veillonella sp. TaxID=1926307 RepID=UPI0029137F9C|nr:phage tail tape measure protein [Veillonella sp.]MDU5294451.1 phage tail tape measure protein [Veillonella sp.]MDU5870071.1 phage tail tape measure protein [Veillonella sp.]